MKKVYDVIIIGGGPAGYSAALYAARAGFDTLVLEKMSVGGQMTLTGDIDNYPGFDEGIDGFSLGAKMQAGAHRFGAKTSFGEVLRAELNKEIKEIYTSNDKFLAKTVIIATGAEPRQLGIEGENDLIGRGVHYCAHCDGRFYKNKTVAVIGGGNSAAADALYLSRLASKVILIHRRDSLRATKIYHEPLLNTENIEILWNTKLTEIISDTRVSGATIADVSTGEKTQIQCNGIFVSIGRKPISSLFAEELDLDEYGYIIADESTRTNLEGVFAIGDVRTKALRQVVTAVADGATAIHFAEEYLEKNKLSKA